MNIFSFILYKSKIIFFLIGLCLLTFISIAQNELVIHGVIKNEVNQLPIEGVNIQLHNTYSGTSTNNQGVFELRINKIPAILTISHISYFGKQVVIKRIQSDTITIFLSSKTVTLSETEITAETYKIFKGKGQEVIDYNFLDTNLLILSYNFNTNHHELILTDESFDTINIKDVSYLRKPKKIFKDCMGNCHLLTKDSAYQVYFLNESVNLIYATHLPKFLSIIGNCLFETPTHLAFEGNTDKTAKLEYAAISPYDLPSTRSKNEEWKHLFYLLNKKTHEKIILDQTYEWKKNQDAFEHAMFRYNDPLNKMFFGEILRSEEIMFYKLFKLSN